ncbi:MAG: PA2779 family protein [Wenzhouxiangella sp.]
MIKSLLINALVALAMVGLIVPAQAQLLSTGDALALESGGLQTRVEAFLLRDEVAAELASLGITHEMAMARVANLSAEELEMMAGEIDDMPAGAGVIYALGVILLAYIIYYFFMRR